MISFETGARRASCRGSLRFVSDPLRFPFWNSAVQAVRNTSGDAGELGSTYSVQRELATGRVVNGLEIFAREHPTEFDIRTTSGPTPFIYRYRLAPEGGSTVVHLSARVELPGVAGMLGPLAARAVRREVDANFAALKQTLEGTAMDAVRSAKSPVRRP